MSTALWLSHPAPATSNGLSRTELRRRSSQVHVLFAVLAPRSCNREPLELVYITTKMPRQDAQFTKLHSVDFAGSRAGSPVAEIARYVLRTDDGRRDGQGSQLACSALAADTAV